MRYREIYELGREKLKEAGIAEAELNARLLLEFFCGTDRSVLHAHPDREVTGEETRAYEAAIARRAERIPLQHITGVQNFMGLDFTVNEQVLIPRQDTEILVEEVMRELHDGMRILDVCTGSGCILLSLLRYSNDTEGVGVDLSSPALAVAKENGERLGLGGRASFVESDLFDRVEGRFDIIVSNPPYIRSDEIDALMPEVSAHEPRMALDGHADGLFFYRRIVQEAGDHLPRGGRLYFEIGCDQGASVSALMAKAGYREIEVRQDYAGLDRVVFGTYYGIE